MSKTGKKDLCEYDGLGLFYKIENKKSSTTIAVQNKKSGQNVLNICFETADRIVENIQHFLQLFEKTTQVQALMLSNNQTCDITDIFNTSRLYVYLQNTYKTALMIYDIENGHFEDFHGVFAKTYNLKSLDLAQKSQNIKTDTYYYATLETEAGITIRAHAKKVSQCLYNLSKNMLAELIAVNMNNTSLTKTNRYLSASSKLVTISLVLDSYFYPLQRVKPSNIEHSKTG